MGYQCFVHQGSQRPTSLTAANLRRMSNSWNDVLFFTVFPTSCWTDVLPSVSDVGHCEPGCARHCYRCQIDRDYDHFLRRFDVENTTAEAIFNGGWRRKSLLGLYLYLMWLQIYLYLFLMYFQMYLCLYLMYLQMHVYLYLMYLQMYVYLYLELSRDRNKMYSLGRYLYLIFGV